MQVVTPTHELLQKFKSKAETLIFEGYCCYSNSATVWQHDDSYALSVKVGDTNKTCFATHDLHFADEVVAQLNGKVELCGVDSDILRHFGDKFGYAWETHCVLYAWNGQPLPHQNVQKTYPMLPKYAQMISDGTPYHADVDEIAECLKRHPSAAIYLDGEPVCWCLCHLEKSLGMLFTKQEYRRHGFALEVMTALCNEVIAKGDIPYAYIVDSNVPSLALAEKYNLAPVKRADYALIREH